MSRREDLPSLMNCLDCTRFRSLLADDVGGHHSSARADIRELGERQTRERRTNLAVEQQWVEIYELFRKLDSPVLCQRRKRFARGWHTLLHEIIAVGECIINRLV